MSGAIPQSIEQVRRAKALRAAVVLLAALVAGLWLARTPDGLLGKADAVGYAVCHRIDLRSFQLGERQLPLCARCTGMFLGALTAFIFFLVRYPRRGLLPPKRVLAVLGVTALWWAVDGFNSYLHLIPNTPRLYTPQNELRLITGSLVGIALMTVLYPVFNQTVWREWKRERVLGSMKEYFGLLLVHGIVVAAVLTENPLFLFPLGILSAVGVIVILTLAYSIMAIPLLQGTNASDSWRQLFVPLALGLTLAMIQIGAIDFLRFKLTGTWDGFHL